MKIHFIPLWLEKKTLLNSEIYIKSHNERRSLVAYIHTRLLKYLHRKSLDVNDLPKISKQN